jgi:hypothetical protein
MITDHLDTEIMLYDGAGRAQLGLRGDWSVTDAIAAAEAYLGLLSDIQRVRIVRHTPWGDEHATAVTRGLDGPLIEPELPYGTN